MSHLRVLEHLLQSDMNYELRVIPMSRLPSRQDSDVRATLWHRLKHLYPVDGYSFVGPSITEALSGLNDVLNSMPMDALL
jgi:hypothetical protein